MERGQVGPASLAHCPQSPLGECSARERESPGCHRVPSPQGALYPLSSEQKGLGRTMSPWRRDAAAPCLLLPRHLAGSLFWAWGWQGSHHPNPIHHREETGTFVPVFPRLVGREGASASLCPASSSSIKIHQQPPALCPTSPLPSSPSVCSLLSENVPAVLGLLFVEGMSLSWCCLVPKCQQELQVLRTLDHPNSLCGVLGLGHWGVHSHRSPPMCPPCLHWCLSHPSSLTLLHLLRNP